MIERYWNQYGPLTAWIALIGIALFVGVQASRGFSEARELEDRVGAVAEQLRPSADGAASSTTPTQNTPDDPAAQAIARLEKRFLFMPPPPQGFRSVHGVLGDRVLYPGGQSFGLGDNAMGATVVAIGTNWVELEFEGQTITLDIFNGSERGPETLRLADPSDDSPPSEESGAPESVEQAASPDVSDTAPAPDANAESELNPEQLEAPLRS